MGRILALTALLMMSNVSLADEQALDTTPTIKFYGLFDVGYVGRKGGSGAVPATELRNDLQSGAGSTGSRLGLTVSYGLPYGLTAIGEAEFGFNQQGGAFSEPQADSKGRADFINRHSWAGLTSSQWGTLIAGKVDGARGSILRDFDAFQGASVASAGQVEFVTSRADDAVAYITPTWKGFNLTVAYTADLFGAREHNLASPVYAYILTYSLGPLVLKYDHEEEWWHFQPGLNRLYVNVAAATCDLKFLKMFAYFDRVNVAEPYNHAALGFFGDLRGYALGVNIPVATAGIVKASFARRDSRTIDNKCNKFGLGYQHNFNKHFYLYTDYAKLVNSANGTCTIAYTNEQTSNDLGANDAGGYGTQGVDFGLVFEF